MSSVASSPTRDTTLHQESDGLASGKWFLGFSFRLPSFCKSAVLKFQVNLGSRVLHTNEESEFDGKGIEELSLKSAELEIKETALREELAEVVAIWSSTKSRVEESLEKVKSERIEFEKELQELLKQCHSDLPPPAYLHFIEGHFCIALSGAVIIANMITICFEYLSSNYRHDHHQLDDNLNNFFVLYYLVEFVIRACLWKKRLLVGQLSFVVWNWLDLVILISGIVEVWICPLLKSLNMLPKQMGQMSWVLALRGLRLLRVIKLLRVFFDSDLRWVMGDKFQAIMLSVIGANSILIALECDFENFWAWVWVEQALLVTFCFELSVRLRYFGVAFFIDRKDFVWNWLDFVIVTGGVLDQWAFPTLSFIQEILNKQDGHKQDNHLSQIMTMLRLLRLLRILRLVRLIRNIPPLYRLCTAMILSMQGVGWVLCLAVIVLYIFALLAVRLVSHGIVFGGEAPPEIAAIFPTVPQTIFIFFNVMNGDTSAIGPLFEVFPISQIFFAIFTILSSWAILSSLTAVISESMIRAAADNREEMDQEEKVFLLEARRNKLEDLFDKSDVDKDMFLVKEEYQLLLEDPERLEKLRDATELNKEELSEMFQHLSRHSDIHGEHIARKDFVEGFQNERRPLSTRALMRFEKRVADLEATVNAHCGEDNQRLISTSEIVGMPMPKRSPKRRLITKRGLPKREEDTDSGRRNTCRTQ